MAFETLPAWFWILYYIFFVITFIFSIYAIVRNRIRKWSFVTVIFVITIPILSVMFGMARSEGYNEFEYLWQELMRFQLWAVYVTIGYLYIVFWWILFLRNSKR
jgi:hypothetical protein